MSVKELLEDILEIKWSAEPSFSELSGYYFTISADNRNRILSDVNEAITKFDSGECRCLVCREGIEALEQCLERVDYVRLGDLALCDTCRGALLVSIENAAIKSEESEEEIHDEQQD